jgi:hypothetical protein
MILYPDVRNPTYRYERQPEGRLNVAVRSVQISWKIMMVPQVAVLVSGLMSDERKRNQFGGLL